MCLCSVVPPERLELMPHSSRLTHIFYMDFVRGQYMERTKEMGCFAAACVYLIVIWGVFFIIESLAYSANLRGTWVFSIICGFGAFAALAAHYRMKFAQKYQGLEVGSYLEECCFWWWCNPCTMCQESRTFIENLDHNGEWFVQQQQPPPMHIHSMAVTIVW